ncbi:hypothetical protein [Mycolicibacillus trivialis]|uniref:hypothetical protein n=1 Tax=Mycolicibacillus trivialis TaxID=1798 RepID=UPI0010566588|nr:hypothetical protein [Mycolicibacillus trivialis]
MPGAYVTGWIKRASNGIVGTNRNVRATRFGQCSTTPATVGLPAATFPADEVAARPASRSPDIVTYDDWRRLDRFERSAGESAGRPRVKLTGVKQMLQYLSQS